METLRLKPRQPVEDGFEDWDDGDFAIDGGDITFRSVSGSTNGGLGLGLGIRRESQSSHVSLRSELESLHGEEEKQVHLPGDDEKSTLDAIAAAANAGIPIPKNVPSSALMGGTIKRLGGRKIKMIIQDDWEHDLQIPESSQGLHIKQQDASQFPDVLRQVSGGSVNPSPTKPTQPITIIQQSRKPTLLKPSPFHGAVDLDRFRDNDDDDDFFGDGAATIKVSKRPAAKPVSFITPPTPQKTQKEPEADDDFEKDLELPGDGKLKLSTRKEIPKTPSSHTDDLDWGEGSLGTRYGGTRRDGRSNRSSSASALSPSVSSSITAESEDETFDGLVIPNGKVNFQERLKRRRRSRSPDRILEEPSQPPSQPSPEPQASVKPAPAALADKEDFLAGLDIGDGEVFDSGKLTLHKNLKVKDTRPASPARPKTAVSLTFTHKPVSTTQSRLPRPSHERAASLLEPVSESGGPILQRTRRSQSRLGHSAQSSVSSVQTPTTPSSAMSLPPSTPHRRDIVPKTSTTSLRNEPTTTSAQLLRLKRSLPAMRAPPSPAKTLPGRFERPPSRTDSAQSSRPYSGLRPKTPVERRGAESAAALARRNPLPFLPAGSGSSQSHHITAKTTRLFRRHDSDNAIDFRPNSRALSRSTMRSPSPRKLRNAEKIAQDGTWTRLNHPIRRRQFGDGNELDGFDDLPTSSQTEARFLRQPVTTSARAAALRNKVYQNMPPPDRTMTPSPLTPYSPRIDYTPHFARDTAASRIARETSLAQRVPSTGPIAPLTAQRVAQLSARSHNPILPQAMIRSKKNMRKAPQLKPHLIANLSGGKESKVINGMFYNPVTYQWEGNENALSAFEKPESSPSTASMPPYLLREKENTTPRPALITNIGTKGVQVVSGMVFDPQNMCWLKLGPPTNAKSEVSDPMDNFNALDDEEDVFKDIPDLEDNPADSSEIPGRVSDVKDDWLVGEEFDVGPEFVRRQREEEDRWKKKCDKWLGAGQRDQTAWRWAIREMIFSDGQ